MKFLRILPETWAKTSWLFSSLTLNMALGNVSRTVAMTSIASSFDNQCPLLPAAVVTGYSIELSFGPSDVNLSLLAHRADWNPLLGMNKLKAES